MVSAEDDKTIEIILDGVAPDAVTDLATGTVTTSSVDLSWTAPGDDGATGTATSYDVRYSTSTITAGNWATATQATGEPAPQVAGSAETFTVTGLSESPTYFFAIKTSDEVPNESALSNVPSTATATTAPDAVADLATGTVTTSSVDLSWTAPGDDGATGTATTYDVRYSTSTITAGNWASATQATGEPAPQVAGSAETFTVTGLSESTTYFFAIKTSDEVPNESALSNVPSAATADGTAPDAVTDLATGTVPTSSLDLSWTAPGDDGTTGTATTYDVRYSTSTITAGNWASATQVTGEPAPQVAGSAETFTVTGLSESTTYFFAIKTSDEVPNESALSNVPSAATATTAPDAVTDLATGTVTTSSVDLSWTAPGDDGATGTATTYDVRYSTSTITAGNWASATQATGEPAPSVAGSAETFTVTGLSESTTYFFAIKTSDEVPNESALSNVPSAATSDGTAPDAVADLATGTVTTSSVDLSWTAPGDDGATGTATTYDVRYSTSTITAGNWATATQATGEPAPQVAGSAETFTVTGLSESTTYFFAIKTSDEVPNESALSNVPSAATATTAPDAVTELATGTVTTSSVDLSWTAPGDDGATGTATTYDVRYSTSTITAGNWASATQATGEPAPQVAGSAETFTVTGLSESTTYFFAIKTSDEVPNESTLSNVPSATTADGTAPDAVTDLATGTVTTSSVALSWTAPGDDGATGTATTYDVRYSTSTITAGNWATATQATGEPAPSVAGSAETFTVTGLSESTTYFFAIKTSDEVPNESALSNVPSAATSDGTAPDAVADLATGTVTTSSVDLSWTAPGDDGATGTATTYDVRYSTSTITAGNWATATQATGEPAPQVAGSAETFTVTGLSESTTYFFAIKTSDEVPNESALSNVPSAATATTAPDAVTELATGTVTTSSVDLSWTAPGDDGATGTATTYDVRYSTSTITAGNWASATQATGEPAPQVAGSAETFTVTGLSESTTYFFAIKTSDEVPNESTLSNVPSATTADGTAPDAVTDLATGTVTTSSVALSWTAPGDDGATGTATTYDVRYSTSTITAGNWATATQATGEPAPQVAGSAETFTVTGLSESTTYFFAIKTSDEVPNESALSNVPSAATATTAPDAVTDLATGTVTTSSVELSWTAPGDDGATGTATTYDVRYSTSTITAGNWASATQATGEPAPSVAGSAETFTVTGLSESTTYFFAIKTSDEVPNESALSNVPSAATSDGTAPDAVADLATGTVTTSSVDLSWTAPGDDGATGTATTYDVRYSTSTITAGNWASATQATGEPAPQVAGSAETFTVTGLSESTTYFFAIKTSDEVPNESTLSNVPSATTADGTAPDAVTDLATGTVTGEPAPQVAGSAETFTVTGLSESTTYFFAIKTSDEVPNESALSNVPSAETATTAPDAVTDLATGTVTTSSVELSWTAPGDDGATGTATTYDVRYSTSTITAGNWASATQATGEPAPSVAGSAETFTVTGLSESTTYFFAIKTSDEVPNESALSNVPSAATSDGTAPDAVADLATGTVTTSSVDLSWTAPGGDGATGTATTYDVRYSTSTITAGNWASATQATGEPAPQVAGSAETFTVTGLSESTTYFFAIKTSDEVPNESALSNVPSAATATTAPDAVTDLATGTVTTSSVDLSWTAPGDDGATGTATTYDVRYSTSTITAGNWASATQATGEPAPQVAGSAETFTVTGLSESTTYFFAIKTSDEVPNESALSNVPSAATSDGTAPDAVADLATGTVTTSSVDLSWTAPGDDGATGTATTYDVRYSTSTITAGNWASATQATGEPAPSVAGSAETFTVTGLSESTTYFFAIKSSDEVPNESALSNVPSATTSDGTAPDAVTDLATGTVTTSSVALSWTAPGDDGATGTATTYDVRYSTSTITAGNWASATQATGEPAPSVAGSAETFTVTGLSESTTYFFAIKTSDEVPNESALSNVPSAATADGTAPDAVADLATGTVTTSSVDLSWTAPGDDGATGTAMTYDVRYSTSTITAGNWASATRGTGEPAPQVAGSAETFTVTGLSESTTYFFAIKTSDEVPNESALSNVPSAATATTAPDAVTDLATGTMTTSSVDLSWTGPGDDGATGTATTYDVRYSTSTITAGNWASATQATGEPAPSVAGSAETFTVTGLSENTTYFFAIKTSDEVPNESTLSNVPSTTTADGTAPDAVADLATGTVTTSSVDLSWTAPGDDGATGTATSYDVRYSTSTITAGNWATATQATGEPAPQVAGSAETFTVTGLSESTTYFFAIKTSDEVPNESALSNVPSATTADGTVPDAVADLATGTVTTSSVALSWTAPGDDGATGTATSYDVRYSTSTITAGNWATATQATGEPAPQVAGSAETFTVTGLSESTTYFFAIKTSDEVPNESTLSNVPSATTADGTAPDAVTDLATGTVTTSSVALSWTAPGDDGATGTGVTQGADPDSARVSGVAAAGNVIVTVTYSIADVVAGTVDTLFFSARSVGTPATIDDGRLELTVIRPNLTTGKAVSPSGTLLPGTELTYTVTITNDGSDAAVGVVVMDSLAVELDFKVGSVVNNLPAGVGVVVEYSDNAGSTWTYVPVSAGCGAPANFDSCVTHIRWTLQNDLSYVGPDNTGDVEFVARIQ